MASKTIPDYIMSLDDPGDMDAPPGSPEWARAMRYKLYRLGKESTAKLKEFQDYLRLMEQHQGYKCLDDPFGHPFVSLKAFCTAEVPFGLGYDPAIIELLLEETLLILLGERLAEIEDVHGLGTNQFTSGGCYHSNTQRGNNTSYWLGRIKRDHPAILEAWERGEFSSVRAAAKAAGFVKDEPPLTALHRAWRKLPERDRLDFLLEMLTPVERTMLLASLQEKH
jgi:hypothetical protein